MLHLMDDPSDYDYRLKRSLGTIPRGADIVPAQKNSLWRHNYELNDSSIFGRNGLEPDRIYEWRLIRQVQDSGLDFFLVAHYRPRLQELLGYFPESRMIRLVNFEKFWNIAQPLKACDELNPTWEQSMSDHNEQQRIYQQLRGSDWPDWHMFEAVGYDIVEFSRHHKVSDHIVKEIKQFYFWHCVSRPFTVFNVDDTIFSKQRFVSKIQDLYHWLCYTDFDPDMVGYMWDHYAEFHGFGT